MVGIVIVSHSHYLAEGLRDMALEVARNRVKVVAAGGVDDETMGTNAERIRRAIEEAYTAEGVVVLIDLSSALLSTQMAIQMFPEERQSQIVLSGGPLVEGAIAATVEAALGHNLAAVNAAAEAAKDMQKLL